MEAAISPAFSGMYRPASHSVSAGVNSGASSVDTEVMVTDSATSARASRQTTLELVPPGAQPTRITPTAISGGSRSSRTTATAAAGMMTYWATTPSSTGRGRASTGRKSPGRRLSPMPNMTSPSSQEVAPDRGATLAGARKPTAPPSRTRRGKPRAATCAPRAGLGCGMVTSPALTRR